MSITIVITFILGNTMYLYGNAEINCCCWVFDYPWTTVSEKTSIYKDLTPYNVRSLNQSWRVERDLYNVPSRLWFSVVCWIFLYRRGSVKVQAKSPPFSHLLFSAKANKSTCFIHVYLFRNVFVLPKIAMRSWYNQFLNFMALTLASFQNFYKFVWCVLYIAKERLLAV